MSLYLVFERISVLIQRIRVALKRKFRRKSSNSLVSRIDHIGTG